VSTPSSRSDAATFRWFAPARISPERSRGFSLAILALLCSEGDSHPSDAGYQALADLVFDVSGYACLGE
jgi:hypothetical protein